MQGHVGRNMLDHRPAAADFIVTARLSLASSTRSLQLAGLGHWQERSEPLRLWRRRGIQVQVSVRVRPAERTQAPVHHPRAARPSRLSVRPIVCLPRAACPICSPSVRPVLSCCPSGKLVLPLGVIWVSKRFKIKQSKNQRMWPGGWPCRHRFTHHHTHTIWNITTP